MLSGKKIFTVTVILAGAVWAGVVSAVAAQFFPFLGFLGSLLGGILAVGLSLIYIWIMRSSTGGRAEEVDGVSLIATGTFLAAALVMNTVLLFLGFGGFNTLLICLNLVLYAAYMVITLFIDRYTAGVTNTLNRAGQKTYPAAEFSRTIGAMLGVASDPAVRSELLGLKEAVDFSSNMAVPAAQALEGQFYGSLQQIQAGLADPAVPAEEVLNRIRQAKQLWLQRNAVVSR